MNALALNHPIDTVAAADPAARRCARISPKRATNSCACYAIPAWPSRCCCCPSRCTRCSRLLICGGGDRQGSEPRHLLFAAFSVMAVTMPALFGIGATLAMERDMGLMRLKRAQPAPPAAGWWRRSHAAWCSGCSSYTPIVIAALGYGKARTGRRPAGRHERRDAVRHHPVLRDGPHDRLAGQRLRRARIRQSHLSTRLLPLGHVFPAAEVDVLAGADLAAVPSSTSSPCTQRASPSSSSSRCHGHRLAGRLHRAVQRGGTSGGWPRKAKRQTG